MSHHENTARDYLLILSGVLIGASAALLFAPQSGKKTRRQLARYSKIAGNRTHHFIAGIGDSFDEVLTDILHYGGQGYEKSKQLTSRARSEILEVLDAGKKYIEEERAKLEKALK
jgi:gas vesicle protein